MRINNSGAADLRLTGSDSGVTSQKELAALILLSPRELSVGKKQSAPQNQWSSRNSRLSQFVSSSSVCADHELSTESSLLVEINLLSDQLQHLLDEVSWVYQVCDQNYLLMAKIFKQQLRLRASFKE